MEAFLILLAVCIACSLLAATLLGVVAFFSLQKLKEEQQRQNGRLEFMAKKLQGLEGEVRRQSPVGQKPETGIPAEPLPAEKPETGPVDAVPIAVAVQTPPAVSAPLAAGSPVISPAPPPKPAEPRTWENLEEVIGKRWMTWVGALILFLSAAFFVKYAFDNQWLGPTARVVLGLAAGMALLVAGDRFVRKEMRPLGQGLMGAGLGVLYVSLFAGLSFYSLYSPEVAFVLMAAVTVAGMTLAVLHDSLPISILAVLGGFLTPVLVSTGKDARDALFAYVLLLDLGVLGVAFFKRYRSLDTLAFAGTWMLFFGWFDEFYRNRFLAPTLFWLGVFYLIFLVLPFVNHLRSRTEIAVERFLMALAHAAIVFAFAYKMLKTDHAHLLGFAALAMCAGYVVLGSLTRKRLSTDARALFGFIAMAVAFLTIAIPLHLQMKGITMAWTIEAPVLLYLGYRYKYTPARAFAGIVLLIAVFRCLGEIFPLHLAPFTPILNANFASALFVPAGAGLFAYIVHRFSNEATNLERLLKYGAALVAPYLGLLVLYQECRYYVHYLETERSRPLLRYLFGIGIWAAGAAGFLAAGVKFRSLAVRVAGLFALAIALLFGMAAYDKTMWDGYILVLNFRFILSLVGVAVVFAYARQQNREEETALFRGQGLGAVLAWSGLAGLFLLVSSEAYTYWPAVMEDPQKARYAAQMSLTIVWGAFAIAGLVYGFSKGIRSMRMTMLALFGLTALKLVLLDTSNVKQLYRIALFVVLGLLMIGASYLYHQAEKRYGKTGKGVAE